MLNFKNLLKPMMIGFAFRSFASVINDDKLKKVHHSDDRSFASIINDDELKKFQYSDHRLYLVSKLTIQGEKSLCSEEDCKKFCEFIKLDDVFQNNHTLKEKYDKIKEICNGYSLFENRDIIMNIIVEDHDNRPHFCHVIITIVNREKPKVILNDSITTPDYTRFSATITPDLRKTTFSMSFYNHINSAGKIIPNTGIELSTSNIKKEGNKVKMNVEIVYLQQK